MPLPLLVIGRCFSHILADVIAIILFINGTMLADVFAILWLMLLPLCCWQMLLPCLADVMPLFLLLMAPIILLWLMLCHIVGVLYFSGISYYQVWLMLLPFVAVWQVLLPLWLMLLPYVAVRQIAMTSATQQHMAITSAIVAITPATQQQMAITSAKPGNKICQRNTILPQCGTTLATAV